MNDMRPDPGRSDDADLRRLLSEATDGIRPLGTLDDIRTRTEKVDPMARRWFLPAIAAAAVMVLAIGGAFWLTQDNGDPDAGPADTPTAVVPDSRAVPVYFVGDAAQGKRLFREFQEQAVCASQECLVLASAQTAVSGTPQDPDYTVPWPEGTEVTSATYNGDVLTIDLTGPGLPNPAAALVAEAAELAIQQLIYSAQAGLGEGRVPVQFLIDGERSTTVLGVPTNEPLAAAEELDVLAPVQISSPSHGQSFPPGDVTVTGVAAVFEANVVWELLVGGDAVVMSGFATAEECCKHTPYEFVLEGLEPGTYTLVVHDEDMSGEGLPVNQDTKDIVIE